MCIGVSWDFPAKVRGSPAVCVCVCEARNLFNGEILLLYFLVPDDELAVKIKTFQDHGVCTLTR